MIGDSDAVRRARLFIDRMEAEQPPIWEGFLEILGVNTWLGRVLVASPFDDISPSYGAILQMVEAENPDIVGTGLGPIEIFHAIQSLCRSNKEIWARKRFTAPDTEEGHRLLQKGVTLGDGT